MRGYVVSYTYDAVNMPHKYRQHQVPNMFDSEAITAQVLAERDDVPEGLSIDWTR